MKAVQIVEPGRPLVLRELPRPEPGSGEVRVRVEAAGVCHSDVHYRDGVGSVAFMPMTPGHEVAGRVDALGAGVDWLQPGERVALHYLASCRRCDFCIRGQEQFCRSVRMLGKDMHGGYAEYVVVPAVNAIAVPDGVAAEVAAVMMCSTATVFHALRRARAAAGDRVAVFGAGGLGLSAVQLARIGGAARVYAVDIDREKLGAAARLGAVPVDPADGLPQEQIHALTDGRGVDIALECAGLALTQQQALASLGVHGRLVLVGITNEPFLTDSYGTVISRELEILGVSDHLRDELVTLMEFARQGRLDFDGVIAERLPLDAEKINARLDDLSAFRGRTRSVIVPGL